jgi:tRNA1(Val) A37 N6-methylase TrmN6
VKLNGFETRISVVRADFKKFHPRRRFDVVFSNPPYIPKQQGSLSASAEKTIAKHEIKCDILGVMRAAAGLLKKRGKAFFVFPVKRRRDFEAAAAKAGLAVTGLRFVHSRAGDPAILFLARCGFEPGRQVVRRPLVLFEAGGGYTAEARRIFAGQFDAEDPS